MPPFEYITYESIKDTSINLQVCRIIQSRLYDYNGDTIVLGTEIMHGDSVNVYVYRNNKFYRIFDFSAQLGDTITVIDTVFEGFYGLNFEPYYLFEYVIDSVSTYIIGGDSLKKFYISPTDSSDWRFGYPSGVILEKVGFISTQLGYSFLGEPINIVTIGTSFGPIRCYQDQQVFYNFMGIPCDTLCSNPNGININSGENNLLKVYPNPFNDRIIVESSPQLKSQKEKCTIKIYNTLGQIVYTLNLNNLYFKYSIDLFFLSEGIYNLKIIQENNIYYNSRIVKY
ncbi:T9SS type A sorting domain-containing protein [bacterium AH-315-M05]|nr:T9SS type A sorting domain-containing protein [bacterium AH-315-M05]